MFAVLLNPPKRRKKAKSRRKTTRRKTARRRKKMRVVTGYRYRKVKGKYKRTKIRRRTKRKRRTAAGRKRARRRSARKGAAKRARRSCATKVKQAVTGVICGTPKRYRRLRKRCRTKLGALTPAQTKWEGLRAKAANPRRRRRRARNGKRRARRRNYSHFIPAYASNPSWVPAYAMNPGRAGAIGTITAGFKPQVLKKAVPVVGGALGNALLAGYVSDYLPGMFQEGIGNLAVGLGTAGILGALSGYVLSKDKAQGIFLGGVIEVVTRGVRDYVLPVVGMSGLGDYLSRSNAAEARNLHGCPGCGVSGFAGIADSILTGSYLPSFADAEHLNQTGVESYAAATGLNPYKFGMQGMGDYLTRSNAAEARNLGAMAYSDVPMEGAVREELNYSF